MGDELCVDHELIDGNEIVLKACGYKYWIEERLGTWALLGGWREKVKSTIWDVVKIRRYRNDKTFPSGKVIKKGTKYFPHKEEWGQYGFSFMSKARAIQELEKITGKVSQFNMSLFNKGTQESLLDKKGCLTPN